MAWSCLALLGSLSIAAIPLNAAAQAQAYPSRTVKLVIPFAVGQGSDIIARAMADKLSKMWNQSVIVENRAGANGTIALEAVSKSAPDGLTLLLSSNSPLVINPNMYKKLPYNVERDLRPIIMIATTDVMFLTNNNVPATNMRDLVAHLKANPRKYSFGSPGTGSTSHLTMEVFKKVAGVDLVHIPYKGSAPALTDLIGGTIQLMVDALPSAMPHVRSGRIRAIALAGTKRSSIVPEMPTAGEAGLTELPAGGWYGFLAPSGTDPAIINKLHDDFKAVLTTPELQTRLRDLGLESQEIMNPVRFGEFLKSETAYWNKMTKAIGMYQTE